MNVLSEYRDGKIFFNIVHIHHPITLKAAFFIKKTTIGLHILGEFGYSRGVERERAAHEEKNSCW